jgi:putative membrane protein
MDIFIRYLHFISIFTIVASLVGEHLFLSKKLPRAVIKKMSLIDAVYGISSITLLISGFMMWFYYGKGEEFYTNNWIFNLKVGLAILLGLLSLPPTIYFLKNRKGEQNENLAIPNYVRICMWLEMAVLVVIPLCAVLMAKGIGYSPN